MFEEVVGFVVQMVPQNLRDLQMFGEGAFTQAYVVPWAVKTTEGSVLYQKYWAEPKANREESRAFERKAVVVKAQMNEKELERLTRVEKDARKNEMTADAALDSQLLKMEGEYFSVKTRAEKNPGDKNLAHRYAVLREKYGYFYEPAEIDDEEETETADTAVAATEPKKK